MLHDNVRFIDNWAGDSGGAVYAPRFRNLDMNSLISNINNLINKMDIYSIHLNSQMNRSVTDDIYTSSL